MSRVDKIINEARDVEHKLREAGLLDMAEVVHALINSRIGSRNTNKQLYKDNIELRTELEELKNA